MATQSDPSTRRGLWYAGLVIAIWSGFILVSRLGGKSPLTAYDVTALRFGVAAALLLPFWWCRRTPRLFDPRIMALAASGGLWYSLAVYSGFRLAPAAHAGILLPGLLPFETAALAWWLLGEKPAASRLYGLAIIAAGLVLLAFDTWRAGGAWLGDLLMLAASLAWALYTVLVRRWGIAAWDAAVGGALVTAICYLPVYLLALPKGMALAGWAILLTQAVYQGVLAAIVAMVLYMKAVHALGPVRLGCLMALIPAIAGVAAVPLLQEPLTLPLLGGLAMVCLGAWVGAGGRLLSSSLLPRSPQCPTSTSALPAKVPPPSRRPN